MKHILNDLTEQEKNAIREQHTGGMKVMTEKFSKLTNSKLGDSKPLVKEQSALGYLGNSLEIQGQLGNFLLQTLPITQIYNMAKSAASGDAKTFNQVIDQEKSRLGQNYQTLKNAVTQGDISKTLGNMATGLGNLITPYVDQMKSGFGNKQPQINAKPQQQPTSTGGGGRLPKTSTGGGGRLPKTSVAANAPAAANASAAGGAGLNEDTSKHKQNAVEMYHNNKRKLEQAIHLLEESAKEGEDTSHFHMVIKMALREMDSYVQDLMK